MSECKPHQMPNTHILAHEFEYIEPASLDEAVSLLDELGGAQVLAGGTNLINWIKMEQLAPEYVVNIGKLPGMSGLSSRDDTLEIGALTRIRTVRNAPQIKAGYTALAEACAAFGSVQVQLMGTIGGNVCNGSPASDTVPALVALDAQLVLVGPDGERTLPIEEFLVGPGETAIREGELLTSIRLPRPQAGTGSAFVKVSRVEADLAKANGAAILVRDGDRVIDCLITLGSVGPTVLRAKKAEAALVGQSFSADLALEAGRVAAEEISPIDDVRSTAWYRREVVKAITHDVLQLAWERAAESTEMGDQGQTAKAEERETGSVLRVGPTETYVIELTVNGTRHRLQVTPNELLLNVLRERLELTGSKYGCGLGECGACTVHLNGQPVLGCMVLAIAADGGEVLTVEGLQDADGALDPLQEAFIEHAAFQCGYCTPGMLMMTKNLLTENPSPTEDDVRDHLKGSRCRCTGFTSIVQAVMSCAQEGNVLD